jgi:hypothetical protein
MKELSKFFGEKTEATVYKDETGYFTTVKSATGIHYTAKFGNETEAEIFAEDWVNKDE